MISNLEDIGVTGSKQQVVVYALWIHGPLHWAALSNMSPLGKGTNNPQMDKLLLKGVVIKHVSYEKSKRRAVYELAEWVVKRIKKGMQDEWTKENNIQLCYSAGTGDDIQNWYCTAVMYGKDRGVEDFCTAHGDTRKEAAEKAIRELKQKQGANNKE